MKRSVMDKCLRIPPTLLLTLSLFTVSVHADAPAKLWIESPRNFTKASDVEYVTNGDLVANWGIRGEHATFLTDYAVDYYSRRTCDLLDRLCRGLLHRSLFL